MNSDTRSGLSRRTFLVATVAVGGGLAVGVYLTRSQRIGKSPNTVLTAETAVEWPPDAFVKISPDNIVTVFSKHTEMGQGVYTGLATIVAEELDAAWSQVRVVGAAANSEIYSNLDYGMQLTGGSASIHNSWDQLRQVGAAMRHMLMSVAAEEWAVSVDEIETREGELYHSATGKHAHFGDFAERAAAQPVPQSVRLKSSDAYQLVGQLLPRTDIPKKLNGEAIYTQDFTLPGMLTAVVAHPPRFGATVKSFDGEVAKGMAGVVDVVAVPGGVAVLAKDFWSAQQARDQLHVEWDESQALKMSSADMLAELRALTDTEGLVAHETGSIDEALGAADRVVEADYEFPYLAHAAMEPMNCIVQITDEGCELWHGAQWQTQDQADAAEILGIPPERVKVNMLYAGGAFGRRATIDYTREAIHVAREAGMGRPVKLVWTREDDMRAGMYRPLFYHKLAGGLDVDGNLVAWHHHMAGQSIAEFVVPGWLENGVDRMSVHGATDMPYEVPNTRFDSYNQTYPVPVLWYRGTGRSHTVFAVETFVDLLAKAGGRDPLAFRRGMIGSQPRLLRVMELAAEKAQWGSPMDAGRARGLAIYSAWGTQIAQVVEVTIPGDGGFKVDRVVTAVDVGIAINPDNIRAQVEGGTGFGLSSAVGDEITLNDGIVEQTNFDRYPVLRMGQMPLVETHIVKSNEAPTGVGDFTPLVIGPAVANAIFAATGHQVRKLPIRLPS